MSTVACDNDECFIYKYIWVCLLLYSYLGNYQIDLESQIKNVRVQNYMCCSRNLEFLSEIFLYFNELLCVTC